MGQRGLKRKRLRRRQKAKDHDPKLLNLTTRWNVGAPLLLKLYRFTPHRFLLSKNQQFLSKGPAGMRPAKDTPAAHFYCIISFSLWMPIHCFILLPLILVSPLLFSPCFTPFVHFPTTQGRWQESQFVFFFSLINSGLFCFVFLFLFFLFIFFV